MKVHGLLLQRHAGGEERRHEGRIAVEARNTRWCSDGLEIGCDNGERVRVAFALDCCDREAMSFVATTSGITGEDVRDLMVAAVEHRFGPVNRCRCFPRCCDVGWGSRVTRGCCRPTPLGVSSIEFGPSPKQARN